MTAQIVFLTLYLGLIGGRQPVEVQVGPEVKTVRFFVDGRESAVLAGAPWNASVDLGAAFEPRELVAIAYDQRGDEVGRTSQIINLPHPAAEIILGLQTDRKGAPEAVTIRWEHVYGAKPASVSVSVDGKKLTVEGAQLHATLPRLDAKHPHVIAAEMRFTDGASARREMVISGGAVSDSISTELTPVVLTGAQPGKDGALAGCFSAKGNPVPATPIETSDAQVFVVREPDEREIVAALDPDRVLNRTQTEEQTAKRRMSLDKGTTMRHTWPVIRRLEIAGHVSSNVFEASTTLSADDVGMAGVLTMPYNAVDAYSQLRSVEPATDRRFADAVAVAALNGITGGHRRAVVFVVDCSFALGSDQSTARPESVRHYLESVGVPLFVWSVSGPRPDLETAWGDIEDISTPNQFRAAVEQLRTSLASQRVVWIGSDPITALRVDADPRCGIKPLARLGR